jgi:serine protease Do
VPVGILVETVEPLSGASNAGIQKGDIITKFDGKAVKTQSDLEAIKDKHKVGDTVDVEIYRITGNNSKGETINLKLTFTEYKG